MTKTNTKTNSDQTTNENVLLRPKIRKPYDYEDQKVHSEMYATVTGSESPTLQSEAEACDINTIVRRAQQTGILASKNMKNAEGTYGEFYEATDYREAMEIVRHANEQFDALPAHVREEFANDPERFLAAVDDPKQQQKLIDLGLATAPPPQKIEEKPATVVADPVKTPETAPKGS